MAVKLLLEPISVIGLMSQQGNVLIIIRNRDRRFARKQGTVSIRTKVVC